METPAQESNTTTAPAQPVTPPPAPAPIAATPEAPSSPTPVTPPPINTGVPPTPAPASFSQPHKSSKLPLILVIFLLFAIGAAAVYFIMAGSKNTTPTSKQAKVID